MNGRTPPRVLLAVVVLGLVLSLAVGFVTAGPSPNQRYDRSADIATGDRQQMVETRRGVTVVTAQKGGMRGLSGELVAFRPNGTVLYHTDRHSSYWDVDPSIRGKRTVTYVATKWLNESVCGGGPLLADRGDCRRNVVERLNLTTGERTRLYAHRMEGGRWHDVDVINDTHILVGDIGNEAVFVVNTTSGIREWTWTAESELPITGGGSYDKDWVHINDVELLDDGRIMVDLRNQDQIAFLNRSRGIEANWTLGSENEYDTLREQHNPDYIPEERGGPAVVVADSENDRVVEYQRENGSWNRSWVWTDDAMQWPRDADRLPNGNTLVTDTIGDRVFEVNETGAIVWKIPVERAYEAERLGTGGESAGGPSAAAAGLQSRRAQPPSGLAEQFEEAVRDAVPVQVQNGLLGYFFPWWMGFYDVLATFALVAVLAVWGGLELWWSSLSLPTRLPSSLDSLSSVRLLLLLTGLAAVGYVASVVASLI
ncbi:arylsulfotransferase family protein [Halorussus gelatinilyticus]|uniref:Arylsulfotransferase family protein n=1 Tax=Halorussus gelatinilyticus TaxID=2937524 RepID=A0A8U0IGU4_9EURY|nr:arylsulfotransferase family protein [Halorussus gelatinilyticus]UPW00193.1 arylsulfotransferase family protein [Halorussus gelatinilyticus]